MSFGSVKNLGGLNNLGAQRRDFDASYLAPTVYLNPRNKRLLTDTAASFDQSNTEHLSINDGAGGTFDFGANEDSFSVFAWVQLDSKTSANQIFVSKNDFGADKRAWDMRFQNFSNENEFQFLTSSDGTNGNSSFLGVSASGVSTSEWVPCLIRYDGSSGEKRIDLHDGTGWSSATELVSGIDSNDVNVLVWAQQDSGTPINSMDGGIDEVAVWRRFITDAERDYLYNSGNGRVYTDVNNAPVQSLSNDTKDFGQSIRIDQDSYVDIADGTFGFGDTDFSVTAWYRVDGSSNGSHELVFYGDRSNDWWTLGFDLNDQLRAFIDDNTNTAKVSTGTGDKYDGGWHFAAVTKTSNEMKLFSDGALVATNNTDVSSVGSISHSPGRSHIGETADSVTGTDGGFEGGIDDVRVYNRALSESEVDDIYNGNSVDTTDIVGYWKFDGDLTDSSGNGNNGSSVGTVSFVEDVVSLAVPVNDSIIAYWGMDEQSGTRADSTGNGNTLTDNNTVGSRVGVPEGRAEDAEDAITRWEDETNNDNNATQGTSSNKPSLVISPQRSVTFDGTDDRLTFGTLGNFGTNLDNNYLIFGAWIKTTGNGSNPMSIIGTFNDSLNTGYQVRIDSTSGGTFSDGDIFVFRRDEDTQARSGTATSSVSDGNWHFIFAQVSATDVEVWVDGVQSTVTPVDTGTADNMANFQYPLWLGTRNVRGTADTHYKGEIGHVILGSSDKYTGDQIRSIYNSQRHYYGK